MIKKIELSSYVLILALIALIAGSTSNHTFSMRLIGSIISICPAIYEYFSNKKITPWMIIFIVLAFILNPLLMFLPNAVSSGLVSFFTIVSALTIVWNDLPSKIFMLFGISSHSKK